MVPLNRFSALSSAFFGEVLRKRGFDLEVWVEIGIDRVRTPEFL